MAEKDTGVKIRVADVIGRDVCISSIDGDRLFNYLVPLLEDKKCVVLSFEGITMIISAFLNNAIGKLYGEFEQEKIDSLVKIEDMSPRHQRILVQVKETAILFYKDPEGYRKAMAEDE